jgi:hypothetical protein
VYLLIVDVVRNTGVPGSLVKILFRIGDSPRRLGISLSRCTGAEENREGQIPVLWDSLFFEGRHDLSVFGSGLKSGAEED